MDKTHCHAGAEGSTADIAVFERCLGLLTADNGHLLLENACRVIAVGKTASFNFVSKQCGVILGDAHHRADGLLSKDGVLFRVVDDPLLVVRVDGAFGGVDKTGAHCNAGGAERQSRCKTVTVGNAACRNDGDLQIRCAATGNDKCSDTVGRGVTADHVACDDDCVNALALRLLNDERFTFFLLLDAKSPKKYEDFIPEGMKTNAVCLPRIEVNWAGVSQITATLNLMQAALENTPKPDYIHFMQGADLPLKTPDEIDSFFKSHDNEFINFQPQNYEFAKYKVLCKHYFTNLPGFRSNKMLKLLNHGIAHLQKPFIDESKQQYHGSALFSISGAFAQKVVADREEIERRYKYSLAADEVFMQNYIMDSEFKDRLTEDYSNARLVDWGRREGNSPRTFLMEDSEKILDAMNTEGICFARKFVASTDMDIVRLIESELKKRSKGNGENACSVL